MMQLHADLIAVLDVVEILSPSCYTVLGEQREHAVDGSIRGASQSSESPMVTALASDLYERLYLRPIRRPRTPRAGELLRGDLIATLSAVNTGQGTWERGWSVRELDPDNRVVVTNDHVAFWASASGLRAVDGTIRAGASCRVRVANEQRRLMPGFYVAIGDGEEDEQDGVIEPLLRYYWHLTPASSGPFLASATSLLNQFGIPFHVKVLSDSEAYLRADAGVLYARPTHQSRIAPFIDRIYSDVASDLRPDVPLFTTRLADGLGFAVGPPGRSSFGQHRCQLVANALWESFIRGEVDRGRRAATVAEAFLREDLDPLRPHLGPSSKDEWDAQPLTSRLANPAGRTRGSDEREPAASSSPLPFADWTLETSALLGRSLCRTAFWDEQGRLCNWIGRSSSERSEYGGSITPTAAALGPDFYGGCAGIALFLAQLFSLTGDEDVRNTATGAIRCSIRQLDRMTMTGRTSPLSFYLGQLGVVVAALRLRTLNGHPEFDSMAESIPDRVLEAADATHPLDVIEGSAGAIPALLGLGRERGLERCRALAITLGEELCRCAIRRNGTCAWTPDAASGPGTAAPPLTGLSHGAAGIGLALLELSAETGQLEFLETARGAFAYEDSLFDQERGNWPDLRKNSPRDDPSASSQFALAWCHGAPGIALSRLRAAELDPARKDDYLRSARVALATTLNAIDEQIENPRADATLCHGLTGLIDILCIASRILDDASYRNRAVEAAHTLIARHGEAGDWPSGAPSGGPNPSLMIGTAGIGYTLLRLHDPERVPSVLWVGF